MALFSERYGYIKVSDVIIREKITPEIQNAICSCYDRLENAFHEYEESTFGMEIHTMKTLKSTYGLTF